MNRIKEFIEDLFDFPRNFLAWLVMYLAKWLDMRVIPNDDPEYFTDFIFEELEEEDDDEIEEDEE